VTKRHRDEVILARWTVDPARLSEFARFARDRYGDTAFTPRDVLKVWDDSALAGIEVVCREDALFVGDSVHDLAAGRAAGVRTGAALWGPFPRAWLERESPDVWLEQPRDIGALR
jgi:phosphoglycolate phosphatase-like HAD superfamily hydrolase